MHNPVRVLAYTANAEASAITGVDSTLDAAATSGRTWTKTVATALSDFDALSIDHFDVVLFYDQPTATAGSLSDLGASLRPKLLSFGEAGGVVIVLDGGSGVDEVPAFLSSTTLLSVDSDTTIRATALDVVAPGDAIGVDVLTPYLSPRRTASFTLTAGTGGDATIVVDEPTSSAPVVLHRVMLLP